MSLKSVAQKLQVRAGQKLLLVNQPNGYAELLSNQLPKNVELLKGVSKSADVVQLFTNSKTK